VWRLKHACARDECHTTFDSSIFEVRHRPVVVIRDVGGAVGLRVMGRWAAVLLLLLMMMMVMVMVTVMVILAMIEERVVHCSGEQPPEALVVRQRGALVKFAVGGLWWGFGIHGLIGGLMRGLGLMV